MAEAQSFPEVLFASRNDGWIELLTGRAEPALRELLARDPAAANVTVVAPASRRPSCP